MPLALWIRPGQLWLQRHEFRKPGLSLGLVIILLKALQVAQMVLPNTEAALERSILTVHQGVGICTRLDEGLHLLVIAFGGKVESDFFGTIRHRERLLVIRKGNSWCWIRSSTNSLAMLCPAPVT